MPDRIAGLVAAPTPAAAVFAASALAVSAGAGIVLSIVDVRTHRLPNRIVLPALAATIALFTASCLCGAPWAALVRALTAGAVVFVVFAAMRGAGRGAMGGGDVKLGALSGVVLGWFGWSAVAVGVLAAFALGGLVGLALLLTRVATRSTRIAFGPFLVAGSWVGALVPLS